MIALASAWWLILATLSAAPVEIIVRSIQELLTPPESLSSTCPLPDAPRTLGPEPDALRAPAVDEP